MNIKLHQVYFIAQDDSKIVDVKDDAIVMMCINSQDDIYTQGLSGKGIMISIGLKNPKVSTVEI